MCLTPPAMTAAEMVEKLVSNLADQEREAHGYLSRLLTHYAPQCEPLPDLMGLCSQIDNLMAGLAAPPPDAGLTTDQMFALGLVASDMGLRWPLGNGREVAASGGPRAERLFRLLQQVRYFIDDMARQSSPDAGLVALVREAISAVLCVMEPSVATLRTLSDSGDVSDWIRADVYALESGLKMLRALLASPTEPTP